MYTLFNRSFPSNTSKASIVTFESTSWPFMAQNTSVLSPWVVFTASPRSSTWKNRSTSRARRCIGSMSDWLNWIRLCVRQTIKLIFSKKYPDTEYGYFHQLTLHVTELRQSVKDLQGMKSPLVVERNILNHRIESLDSSITFIKRIGLVQFMSILGTSRCWSFWASPGSNIVRPRTQQ